jgi:hypothetical protein
MQLRDAQTRKVWVCRGATKSEHQYLVDRSRSLHGQFKVKHMMISNVLGEFASITGVLERDENDITKSKIRGVLMAAHRCRLASASCCDRRQGSQFEVA